MKKLREVSYRLDEIVGARGHVKYVPSMHYYIQSVQLLKKTQQHWDTFNLFQACPQEKQTTFKRDQSTLKYQWIHS